MAYSKAYVFAVSPSGQHVWAGTMFADDGVGHFEYSQAWLAEEWAYPLDPQNLPLSTKRYRAVNRYGIHGVFRDAAPDDWGTRIMLLRNEHAPANELERLIRTSGGGVGCLRFSLSRDRAKEPADLPSMSRLQELASIAERLDAKQHLEPEELALLEPGSSMGGARPKVTVDEDGVRWLVKFGRIGDLVDVPLLEHCSMRFLHQVIGLDIPPTQMIPMGSSSERSHAFAIQRFDNHIHFISANSVFNQDRIRSIEDSKRNPYSYCNLASIIRKHGTHFKQDNEELFTRMVANIVMGNTDDHARNHALMYDIVSQAWRLTPAYDMLPIVAVHAGRQAMGVGKFGAKASIENALSYAKLFGLSEVLATEITRRVFSLYQQQWLGFCEERGVKGNDLALIKQVMLK